MGNQQDPGDESATEWTSVTVDAAVKDRLDADKPDGASWSDYLLALHDGAVIPEQSGGGDDVADLRDEVRKLREQVDKTPVRTADEVEDRFA